MRKVQMHYYRAPETGEIVRFMPVSNQWDELRCDVSTRYHVRWCATTVLADPETLTPVTVEEMATEGREMYAANAAARGELLLKKTHPHTTFMLF